MQKWRRCLAPTVRRSRRAAGMTPNRSRRTAACFMWALNYEKDGLLARGYPIDLPRAVRSLPSNKGLEALVFIPSGQPLAGSLIAVSERGLDREGNIKAFLIGGPAP